jgi:hypothetical protein
MGVGCETEKGVTKNCLNTSHLEKVEMSVLAAFCNQLVRFFEELEASYPEEKSISMGLESIKAAKRANPKLVLDMFYEYIYKPANDLIMNHKDEELIKLARNTMSTRFNELMPALVIFDKYWSTMSQGNREAIWKYLEVLCKLCEKAKEA